MSEATRITAPGALLRAGIGTAALIAGGAAAALILTSDFADSPSPRAALSLVIGLSFIGSGLVAWTRRPGNRVGPLMVFVGFAWFVGEGGLAWASESIAFTLGITLQVVYIVAFAHLLLAFPSGYLSSRLARAVIVLGYLDVTVVQLSWILFADPEEDLCCGVPTNAFQITHNQDAVSAILNFERGFGSLLTLIGVGILASRWRSASVPERRGVGPVMWAGALAFAVLILSLVNESVGDPLGNVPNWLFWVAFATVPFAFLAGLLHLRLARAAVADLVVELGETPAPGRLGDALARTLGDPSLALAYWLPERERYVDVDGHPVDLPGAGGQRVTTVVEHEGRRVAALVHDASLREDPALIDAVCAAAGLALENERLQADVRARLDDLESSRARIVEAADAERRKIERNLHDGAQQRLVSLSLTLSRAQAGLRGDPEQAARLLGDASDELSRTIDELRELARGIHPAILTDRGLDAALESLVAGVSIPVELRVDLHDRLPRLVEAAAYYAVAEALTNLTRYAQASTATVNVSRADGRALIEVSDDGVGGANPAAGTGLRGLADRLAALDGRLEVRSPAGRGTTVRAAIPIP